MAPLTRSLGFGIVSPSLDPLQVRRTLNDLSAEDIDRMKQKAIEARNVFHADNEMGKLGRLYENLAIEKKAV